MPFIQLTIKTNDSLAETYSDYLVELGALSVTFEDAEDNPLFEPLPNTTPLWQTLTLVALFDATTEMALIEAALQNTWDTDALKTLKIEPLEDKDWVKITQENFKPLSFGNRLAIYPSLPTDAHILLSPGLAFGTGTHPTTHLCLEWLAHASLDHKTVIDYGCGSGILGIAALKLGASLVYAVDNDPQALLSTQNNAKQNGLTSNMLQTFLPTELKIAEPVDILIANILIHPLIELAPVFKDLLKPNGTLVLSGFLESQLESLRDAYQSWISFDPPKRLGDWVMVMGNVSVTRTVENNDELDELFD